MNNKHIHLYSIASNSIYDKLENDSDDEYMEIWIQKIGILNIEK